jgi:hypothetical protein
MKRGARTVAAALAKAWQTPSLSHGPHQQDKDGRDRHKCDPCVHRAAGGGGGDSGGHDVDALGKVLPDPTNAPFWPQVLSLSLLLLLYKPAREAKQATKKASPTVEGA